MAGCLALALSLAFTRASRDLRLAAIRTFSGWSLFWLLPTLLGGLAYYHVIPRGMLDNMPVALGTQQWEQLYAQLSRVIWIAVGVVALTSLWGLWQPARANLVTWVVPVLLLTLMMGYFERAREFVRKPYVIGYYMYSNSIRVDDVPYLTKTGRLPHASGPRHSQVPAGQREEAGRDMFMLLCSRCHTMNGINSIRGNLARLYPGQSSWDAAAIESFLRNIHGARPFMPPFIGSTAEREALAAYLATLDDHRDIPPPVSARPTSRSD